jgi:hypothetical protein
MGSQQSLVPPLPTTPQSPVAAEQSPTPSLPATPQSPVAAERSAMSPPATTPQPAAAVQSATVSPPTTAPQPVATERSAKTPRPVDKNFIHDGDAKMLALKCLTGEIERQLELVGPVACEDTEFAVAQLEYRQELGRIWSTCAVYGDVDSIHLALHQLRASENYWQRKYQREGRDRGHPVSDTHLPLERCHISSPPTTHLPAERCPVSSPPTATENSTGGVGWRQVPRDQLCEWTCPF